MRLYVSFMVMLCLVKLNCFAQTTDNYPVQTTVYFGAPTTQRLSDWFTSDQRLFVQLLLKDLTKPSVSVYLRWQLDGPGIRIATRAGYVPPAFLSLTPGLPTRLKGIDLAAHYFSPAILETEGLDPSQAYNASLPEGFYTFSVQAFEASTGQVVSNTAQTFLVLSSPQPPILNLPANGTSVPVNALQKVLFQWTPRHFATPESQVVYRLKVCRVPEGEEPNEQTMLTCAVPVLDKTDPGTSLPGDITGWIQPLEPGERYAVQVQAIDLNRQLTNFANQGYSPVQWFRYGQECLPPASFTLQSVASDRVRLRWEAQSQALAYVVEYKAETATEWISEKVYGTTYMATGLQNKTTYLFRIRSDCGGLLPSAPSQSQAWNLSEQVPEPTPEWPLELRQPALINVQTVDDQSVSVTTLQELYVNYPVPAPTSAGTTSPIAPNTGAPTSGVSSATSANGSLTTKLKIPDCALRAGSFADCQPTHPVIPLPTGEELTSLSVGDVLGIYDFALLVTKVGQGPGLSGEGLVRLPFLGNAMVPMEFKGVKAKKGEEGTNGGCMYAIDAGGYVQSKNNVSAKEFMEQRQSLIQTVVRKSHPTAFAGTLQQALQHYDLVAQEISEAKTAGQPVTSGQVHRVRQYTAAILQGSSVLKTSLEGVAAANALAVGVLADLKTLTEELTANQVLIGKGQQVPVMSSLEARYQALFERLKQIMASPVEPPVMTSEARITNASVSSVQAQSAKIAWTGSKMFARYSVLYAAEGEGELTQSVTNPQLALTTLKPGRNYTVKILGYDLGGALLDTYGPTVFATPANTLPPPENVAYTVQDDGSVNITWNKNSLHQHYKLTYKDASGEERTLYPTTNAATLTGIDLTQHYGYEIVAFGNEQSVSEPALGGIFTVICRLSVKAEKTTVGQNESVTLFAFGCEPQHLTWSTGQKAGRTLTVSPRVSTVYFAVCQVPGNEACSDFVEIKVLPPACEAFTVTASQTDIEPGQPITLTAKGCSGQLAWNKSLGTQSTVTLSPYSTMDFTATCSNGSSICEKTVRVKVKCDIILHISTNYDGSFLGLNNTKEIIVRGSCNNGPLLLNGREVKEGNWGVETFPGKDDLTLTATCGQGEDACAKTVQVKAVSRKCNGFMVLGGVKEAGLLTLETWGCSEGNTVTWDNGMTGGTITVPLPAKATMFKAMCGRNECEDYYTYEGSTKNNYFSLEVKHSEAYPRILTPTGCYGEVGWESTPLTNLAIELNTRQPALTIPSNPLQTTVYTATCKTKDNQLTQRSYTIQAMPACISVYGPQTVVKGEPVTLTAIGCLGTAVWKSTKGTVLSQGLTITEIALATTEYEVNCDNPVCNAKQTVEVRPCEFTVSVTKSPVKAGEATALTATGCNGTVSWQDPTGTLLGWGEELVLHPLKSITVTATCDISQCQNTGSVIVSLGKLTPIQCEPLFLSAGPNPIAKGESNTVQLTASGCTGGMVTWNGPLIAPDTPTSYPDHTLTLVGLQQAATYTATCTKTALPPTYATIDIQAEIRFTLKAFPEAVETGKTTALTAEGCMGGTIVWKTPTASCTGSPCTINSPVITAPATFEATCLINGQTIGKSVNVSLKNSYGSVVYQPVCSDFWASYSAPPQAAYPLPSGLKITLQQGGCRQGTIKWKAQDAQGNIRTLAASEDRPAISTTYTATCETNGAICAQKQFLVEVHRPSCQDFEVSVTRKSSSGQVGGAESGNISFTAEYNGNFLIEATGCISHDKQGTEQLSVAYYPIAGAPAQLVPNNNLLKPQLNSRVEISCIANPITYPDEVCKYTLYFEAAGIRRENNSNARIGDSNGTESTRAANSDNATVASGCTMSLPLKDLMADYVATLLCNNIHAFYDEYGQFSAEKTATFLATAENHLRNDPAFSSYQPEFPEDFSDIIDQLEALEGDCEGVAEIAQSLTTEMKGTMPVDAYNEAATKSYAAVEAAARDELAPEDNPKNIPSFELTTDKTENKCIPIAVLIYTLKSSILYKHNLKLHALPQNCLTTQESNVIVNPAINEMTLPLVKVRFSDSFQAEGLTVTTPTLVALVDPNDAKRVVIMRGSTPLIVFALDTEENAKRLADYFGVAPVVQPANATFPITGAQLKEIFPTTKQDRCDEVAELINKYSDKFEINTPLRMAHFLGQIGVETGGLKKLKEDNCYTSKSRIKEIFGKPKYCDLFEGYESDLTICDGAKPMSCTPQLNAITSELVVKDKYICSTLLFDYVYSCRMGNRATVSKDGSTFAGVGFIHLTGRGLYKEISEKWNQDPDNATNQKYFHLHPDENGNSNEISNDLEIAMKASMYYWKINKTVKVGKKGKFGNGNTFADEDTIVFETQFVNGGQNALDERERIKNKSFEILNK